MNTGQLSTHLSTRMSGRSAPGRPRFVLLHGFTQTARSWHRLAERLEQLGEVVIPDLPGHGRSAHVVADLPTTASLLGGCGPGVYIGYSMGARVALHIALNDPQSVGGLVLIGGTGGLDSDDERRARREADERLATDLEHRGVEPFLKTWLAGPLFSDLAPDPVDIAGRLTNTVGGLAMSLRLAGTGSQEPLWDRLSAIDAPTLVVAGANDAKFTGLGRRLQAAIGANASFVTVADAGHAAHLEKPEAFAGLLLAQLTSLSGRDRPPDTD